MRVYLDVCCLNRPFDDQTQERIRLETSAIAAIFQRIEEGELVWVSSRAVRIEIARTSNAERRARLLELAIRANHEVGVDRSIANRADEIQALGFRPADALHLACAERGGADVFLSTDDVLVRRASRLSAHLRLTVVNPAAWLMTLEAD